MTNLLSVWGWFNNIGDSLQSFFGAIVFTAGEWVYAALFSIWSAMAAIVNTLEFLISVFAGLSSAEVGGEQVDDIVIGVVTSEPVLAVFGALIGFAIVMMIFFTIIQLIRNQYKEKNGGNPFTLVFRMFKGMIMFLFITVAVIVGLTLSRVVLLGLNGVVRGGEDISLTGTIFLAMASDANLLRIHIPSDDTLTGAHILRGRADRITRNDGSQGHPAIVLAPLTTDIPDGGIPTETRWIPHLNIRDNSNSNLLVGGGELLEIPNWLVGWTQAGGVNASNTSGGFYTAIRLIPPFQSQSNVYLHPDDAFYQRPPFTFDAVPESSVPWRVGVPPQNMTQAQAREALEALMDQSGVDNFNSMNDLLQRMYMTDFNLPAGAGVEPDLHDGSTIPQGTMSIPYLRRTLVLSEVNYLMGRIVNQPTEGGPTHDAGLLRAVLDGDASPFNAHNGNGERNQDRSERLARAIDTAIVSRSTQWQLMIQDGDTIDPVSTTLGLGFGKNAGTIRHLYHLASMYMFIGYFAMGMIIIIFFGLVFALIHRIIEMAALYMLSPLTIAFFPFDDGAGFKNNFVQPFYKKAIGAYAVVLSLNVFFIILPVITSINIFPTGDEWATRGLHNHIVSIVITIGAFTMVPKLRSMISSMLGAEDIQEKKFGQTLKEGFSAAVGAKTAAFVGASAAQYAKRKAQSSKPASWALNRLNNAKERRAKNQFAKLTDEQKEEYGGSLAEYRRQKAKENKDAKEAANQKLKEDFMGEHAKGIDMYNKDGKFNEAEYQKARNRNKKAAELLDGQTKQNDEKFAFDNSAKGKEDFRKQFEAHQISAYQQDKQQRDMRDAFDKRQKAKPWEYPGGDYEAYKKSDKYKEDFAKYAKSASATRDAFGGGVGGFISGNYAAGLHRADAFSRAGGVLAPAKWAGNKLRKAGENFGAAFESGGKLEALGDIGRAIKENPFVDTMFGVDGMWEQSKTGKYLRQFSEAEKLAGFHQLTAAKQKRIEQNEEARSQRQAQFGDRMVAGYRQRHNAEEALAKTGLLAGLEKDGDGNFKRDPKTGRIIGIEAAINSLRVEPGALDDKGKKALDDYVKGNDTMKKHMYMLGLDKEKDGDIAKAERISRAGFNAGSVEGEAQRRIKELDSKDMTKEDKARATAKIHKEYDRAYRSELAEIDPWAVSKAYHAQNAREFLASAKVAPYMSEFMKNVNIATSKMDANAMMALQGTVGYAHLMTQDPGSIGREVIKYIETGSSALTERLEDKAKLDKALKVVNGKMDATMEANLRNYANVFAGLGTTMEGATMRGMDGVKNAMAKVFSVVSADIITKKLEGIRDATAAEENQAHQKIYHARVSEEASMDIAFSKFEERFAKLSKEDQAMKEEELNEMRKLRSELKERFKTDSDYADHDKESELATAFLEKLKESSKEVFAGANQSVVKDYQESLDELIKDDAKRHGGWEEAQERDRRQNEIRYVTNIYQGPIVTEHGYIKTAGVGKKED